MKSIWQWCFWLACMLSLCSAEIETASPAPSQNVTSSTPTPAPSGNSSVTPTLSMPPTISMPPTVSPTLSVVPTPSNSSIPPSYPPSPNPSNPPTSLPTPTPTTPQHHHKHKPSLWRILGKTLAWLIIIALSVLLFGAIMSNRYRIYYYIRSGWYSFLRSDRTQWVVRKLHLQRFFGGQEPSLNEIIFDNNLGEGLLMQES